MLGTQDRIPEHLSLQAHTTSDEFKGAYVLLKRCCWSHGTLGRASFSQWRCRLGSGAVGSEAPCRWHS